MAIPQQIIVNADDIGLKDSVNKAILYSFEQGYINSCSLLTNMDWFAETVELIHNNPIITNIGLHINFAEGKPVTDFKLPQFLKDNGEWNLQKTGSLGYILNKESRAAFFDEINAQIDKALKAGIKIVHLDSHLHLHTIPAFYNLFIQVAKQRQLKLRLAQTYREGSYLKFYYREYINNQIKRNNLNYSDLFETVTEFLKNRTRVVDAKKIELMVHPDFDAQGKLFDHVGGSEMANWIDYLNGR